MSQEPGKSIRGRQLRGVAPNSLRATRSGTALRGAVETICGRIDAAREERGPRGNPAREDVVEHQHRIGDLNFTVVVGIERVEALDTRRIDEEVVENKDYVLGCTT